MSRRWAGVFIAGAALVVIAAFLLLRAPTARESGAPATALAPAAAAPVSVPVAQESRKATLWLPASGGRIAPLEIDVTSAAEPKARIEALLRALFAARPAAPLSPLFDPPVELATVLRGPGATLYVDLASKDGAPPPGSGSMVELQRVYSIVHTVVRNEPSVERVVLLWNGVQRRSLAGHVDTGRPLVPRPELEARTPGEQPEQDAQAPRSEAQPARPESNAGPGEAPTR